VGNRVYKVYRVLEGLVAWGMGHGEAEKWSIGVVE